MKQILVKARGNETTTINSNVICEVFKQFCLGFKIWFVYPSHKEEVINIESNGVFVTIHTTGEGYKYHLKYHHNIPYEIWMS